MKIETIEQQKREDGFTLVELAIVMIIIGLLIGGILKGQELIANSQTTATIAQVKGIDAAVSTFRDKYSALPGDMTNGGTRLQNCSAVPCNVNGNQDGRILGGAEPGDTTDQTSESVRVFAHLAAADLLSGIDANYNDTPALGIGLPEAKVGGGFVQIAYSADGDLHAAEDARVGHYLVLHARAGVNATQATANLAPARAGQIDRKLDDGNADTGSVRATTANPCSDANGTYNEGRNDGRCAMYFRVQG